MFQSDKKQCETFTRYNINYYFFFQAYTSFGKKVKTVNKKLDVKITTELGDGTKSSRSVASLLSEADLSPMPSPGT